MLSNVQPQPAADRRVVSLTIEERTFDMCVVCVCIFQWHSPTRIGNVAYGDHLAGARRPPSESCAQ